MSGDGANRFEAEKAPGAYFLDKPIDTDRLLALLRAPCEAESSLESRAPI